MTPDSSDDEIVSAFFANFQEEGDGPNFDAFLTMSEIVRRDPERAWHLTVEMLRTATDPLYQAYVAAGPLENLMNSYGLELIDRVEELASREPWFRECLAGVWGHMEPEIRARVDKAILGPMEGH
jgi:hypothetical protein